jgi:hypothetical protein
MSWKSLKELWKGWNCENIKLDQKHCFQLFHQFLIYFYFSVWGVKKKSFLMNENWMWKVGVILFAKTNMSENLFE